MDQHKVRTDTLVISVSIRIRWMKLELNFHWHSCWYLRNRRTTRSHFSQSHVFRFHVPLCIRRVSSQFHSRSLTTLLDKLPWESFSLWDLVSRSMETLLWRKKLQNRWKHIVHCLSYQRSYEGRLGSCYNGSSISAAQYSSPWLYVAIQGESSVFWKCYQFYRRFPCR